jgi:hypothetical protein
MTSWEEAERAMYSASAVDSATLFWSLLAQETGPPDIIEMKPVRERRSIPSAKEESCQIRRSGEIEPEKVRQRFIVPER